MLPLLPGVYLYKDAHGGILYVGKAKNLRNRVRSYFNDDKLAEPKTGSLIAEATDVDFIQVDNEKEALALENNLIKQYKPRFNILLRDDKTYPYIKLTAEKYPRVYVTRRLRKDGATYFGPYFPGNLAHRLVHFIHRHFKIPSCYIDLNKRHAQPCLEYHIHRCLGPCAGMVGDEEYKAAANNVRLFLEGRMKDLTANLRRRMQAASDDLRFEEAAALRNLITTVEEMEERQKMAAAEGDDTDIFAYYAEPPLVAVNLFHLRNGRIVDRREYFWENQHEFSPVELFTSLLMQVYLDQQYIPGLIHVPLTAEEEKAFEDHDVLEEILTEKRGRKVEIVTPQRGQKKAMLDLAETNAKHIFEQRFRVLKPSSERIKEALADALGLEKAPNRIECFDISHIQGTDKVASMVVWEDGRMKKSDYRKFIIRTVEGNDDFASMREVITRRYGRIKAEAIPSADLISIEGTRDLPEDSDADRPLPARMPGLVLVDGGLGQLHAAAEALESLELAAQPLASIAKREEWIYVLGQESEPIILDKHSPILHLVQQIRDEAHRFAVTFHRSRRSASRLTSELSEIPGIGPKTVEKLLRTFGSVERLRDAGEGELVHSVGRAAAQKLKEYFSQVRSAG
ncbi:MAG: excinuclease ABC subunit UvrC [Bryobacteraceae bacterium]